MGLVFPLQPVRRRSTPQRLQLQTTSKRFTVGGTLIFIALILFSMYLAAGPLFQSMMEQGAWLDKLIALSFYSTLFVFPLIALLCWFYQERLLIEAEDAGAFRFQYRRSFGPFTIQKASTEIPSLEQLQVHNWIGSRNMASIAPDPNAPEQKRYATRGHWMLSVPNNGGVLTVERRAKREEIDWLAAVIRHYFEVPASKGSNT